MPPMLFDVLHAILELGLPVAVLSWLLFYRLYSRGDLARDADRKSIGKRLKSIRKGEKESRQKSDSLVHGKWMKFGGGFYGVAAAWTLVYIEASGIIGAVVHPSVIVDMFDDGIGNFIVQMVTGQVATFVDAATWFVWWPGRGHGPVVWFGVAYVAYLAGMKLARYEVGLASRIVELDSRAWWRSQVPFARSRTAVKAEGADQQGQSDGGK